MISKTVILARQSVETKYLRMTQPIYANSNFSAAASSAPSSAAREQMPVDIGRHLDRRVPQAMLHHFERQP